MKVKLTDGTEIEVYAGHPENGTAYAACILDSHHGQYSFGYAIQFAQEHGWPGPNGKPYPQTGNISANDAVIEDADRAIDWLNEHGISRESEFSFGWREGELYLADPDWWEEG